MKDEESTLHTDDIIGIQQLLFRYCHVVDRGTVEEIAALFHPAAVLLPEYESDKRYQGRDSIQGWYERYDQQLRKRVRFLRHKIESPVINVTGDDATSVCYLDADAITISTDKPVVVFGRYDDRLVRQGDSWYFLERKIISYYSLTPQEYTPGRGTK